MVWKTLVGGACVAAILATAAMAAPVMYKGDPQLSGVYAAPSPNALKGVRFTFRTGGPIRGTPALADGVLYFASTDGNVYAVDAITGMERWHRHAGIVNSSPSVVDGTVYFTGRDGMLTALAAADGATRWTFALGKDLGPQDYWEFYTSSPTPFGDALYVGSGDGHLYVIDRTTGHERWRFDTGARVRATPAVTDALVVVCTMGGKVFAVDRKTGAQRWMFASQGATNTFAMKDNDTTSISSSPTIADGVVTFGGRDAFLYGIDLATGKQKWRTTHDSESWILGVAAQSGRVYSASGSAAFLQSANLQTGAENWRAPSTGAVFAAPTLAGDDVLFDDFGGDLHVADKQSGKELWHFPMGDRAFASPIVGPDGTVYAASDSGILYALATVPEPAKTPPAKRYLYWEGPKDKNDFSVFRNEGAIRTYFIDAGYILIDEAGLRALIAEQQQSHAPSIVVFGDGRARASLFDTHTAAAPIRQYLDAGGRVVFLSTNPLAHRYDPKTGELMGYDFAVPETVFGLHYPPRNLDSGYHISTPTDAGRFWGLQGPTVTNGTVDPADVSLVLARDEFGNASAWLKTYGNGGALLQLQVPRNPMTDLTSYRIAIEHGL